jgi:hypothetical protein
MLLAIVLITVLRSVIGVLTKIVGGFLNGASQPGTRARSTTSGGTSSAKLGGDLHRDPVCGTFVAESTPYQRRVTDRTFFYCSDACKEKHQLVAR